MSYSGCVCHVDGLPSAVYMCPGMCAWPGYWIVCHTHTTLGPGGPEAGGPGRKPIGPHSKGKPQIAAPDGITTVLLAGQTLIVLKAGPESRYIIRIMVLKYHSAS